MKIFISLKVPRGDAERERLVDELPATLKKAGHNPFVATEEISRAKLTSPKDFMPFVRENLKDTDLFIVIYHPELRGGLIETGIAYEREIPIWLCHKPDEKVSSSLFGCADRTLTYNDVNELKVKITKLSKEKNRMRMSRT
ncbi:MAG: hypothetical protein GY755_17335 [Chloroflexi bacterium]|nr:hypothetical protein [Chloroflexota bacterium]